MEGKERFEWALERWNVASRFKEIEYCGTFRDYAGIFLCYSGFDTLASYHCRINYYINYEDDYLHLYWGSNDFGEFDLKKFTKQYHQGLEEIKLKKESNELLLKLYPEHGEDYVNTQEWKDYVVKGAKYSLKAIEQQIKDSEEGYKLAHNTKLSNQDARQKTIKQIKDRIKACKEEIKEIKKHREKIYS